MTLLLFIALFFLIVSGYLILAHFGVLGEKAKSRVAPTMREIGFVVACIVFAICFWPVVKAFIQWTN